MSYRASPADGVAWITGASSGIGRAVALELAHRGFVVAATARRIEALEALAREAEGASGRVIAHPADVTDRRQMDEVAATIEAAHGPICLAFLNAGVAPGTRAEGVRIGDFRASFEVNLFGLLNGLEPVWASMAGRRRGQIAVNASLAGYRGLPGAAAYGASKAAVIHLAEALRFEADDLGIRLQIVNPGFVRTPMTDRNDFPMPFLISADEAARRICDGFMQGGFEITFPRPLSLGLKLARLLPDSAYFPLVKRVTRKRTPRDRL